MGQARDCCLVDWTSEEMLILVYDCVLCDVQAVESVQCRGLSGCTECHLPCSNTQCGNVCKYSLKKLYVCTYKLSYVYDHHYLLYSHLIVTWW